MERRRWRESHYEISLRTLTGQRGIEKSIAKIRKLFQPPSFQISRKKKIGKIERERERERRIETEENENT